MKVYLNMIIDRLDADFYIKAGSGDLIVTEAKPDPGSTNNMDDDTLYLVDARMSLTCSTLGDLNNVLFVVNSAEDLLELPHEGNIVVSIKSVEELCQDINRVIKELYNWGDRLFELTVENRGLQKLIDHSALLLVNPIILFDSSYKILGFSANLDVSKDESWKRSLKSGYVSLSDEQFFSMKQMILSTASNPDENIYSYPYFENRFFHKNIQYKNRLLAHFTIIEQVAEISAGQIELARHICNILLIELQKKEMSIFTTNKFYEYLFKEMITNPGMTSAEIKERLHYLNPVWKENMFVLSIDMNGFTRKRKEAISRELPYMIQDSKKFEHDNFLVVLLETMQKEAFSLEEKRAFLAFLQSENLKAGISDVFSHIEYLSQSYSQSIKAIKFQHSKESYGLFNYSDARLSELLDQIASMEKVECLYFPPVVKLVNDKESSLLITLMAYIDNLNNQKATAQVLGIHRTTLIYRINKLQEKMGVDLSDSDILFHIKLTLEIMGIKNDPIELTPLPN